MQDRRIPLAKPLFTKEMEEKALDVLRSGRYVLGEENRLFEEEFAALVGRRYAVAVNSGTAALYLALNALGVGRGDEVVLPSFTFFADAEVVLLLGAKPVFCDIDADNYCVGIKDVKACLSKKTKVIIPVHLFGHPADMDPILKLSSDKDVSVVEDCCQAHGARYRGRFLGSFGEFSCLSFYPSKVLTVAGDGGMLLTDNEELAEKARRLRNHGQVTRYVHREVGFNFRLNEVNAAIGRIQLKHLAEWVEERRSVASLYDKGLRSFEQLTLPTEASWAYHCYNNYTIRTPRRDELRQWLESNGVSCGVYYPIPCHKQPVYLESVRGRSKALPRTESLAGEVLSLPIYPTMTESDVAYVCDLVGRFFK